MTDLSADPVDHAAAFRNKTVCKTCVHLQVTFARRNGRPPEWYDCLCGAKDVKERSINYVAGTIEYRTPYCRDINRTGHCPHYEAKGE